MAQSGSKKGARPMKLGSRINRGLVGLANRIDYLRLLEGLARSKRGRPWLDRYQDLGDNWPQKEDLARLAVDLTLAQLEAEGLETDRAEVSRLVDRIKTGYDPDIHKYSAAGLSALLSAVFSHQDPASPFLSPDGRDAAHLEELKAYQSQGLGAVYLVNHSSHLDEFLLACVVCHTGLKLPLFAAGSNMMAVPSLAKLLMAGSYVVHRRGAGRADLAALFNYCRAISETGGQQGIFLEAWHGGARSRDGGLRYPRRLVALRGALAAEKDVVVQPVAISYSIVPEDLSLAARKGRLNWVRGLSPWGLLGRLALHPRSIPWDSLEGLYGRAYLTMPRPRLLSELKEARSRERSDLEPDEYVALAAIREIARTKKIMASQLTALGLARAGRWSSGDLLKAMEFELKRLSDYHRSAFDQEPDLEDFIRENDLPRVAQDGLATLRKRKIIGPWSKRHLHGGEAAAKKAGFPRVLSNRGLAFYAIHGDRRIYSPTASQNLVVVGGGDWGFALLHLIGQRILEEKRYHNASLTLFEPRSEQAARMNELRSPEGRFENRRLPRNAFVTSDPTSAFRKASEIILATEPRRMADQVGLILHQSEQPLKLVVAACGFEPQSLRLPCQVALDLAAQMGREDLEIYALVGPVEEDDLVEGRPAAAVLAGPEAGLEAVADLFNWPPVELEKSLDPLGIQAAAILARVYAMWGNVLTRTGELKGPARLGAYMARTAAEALQLGLALGGRPESFSSACQAWTATFVAEALTGPTNRFGRKLGGLAKRREDLSAQARKVHQALEAAGQKNPAYHDLKTALLLARRNGLELPILEEAGRAIWAEELGT